LLYFALFIGAIVLGLASRSKVISLPPFIAAYSGDTIWALMVFFLMATIFPRWKTKHVFIAAIVFAFCIEFSQLYQAPWINEIRRNRFARLVIGVGFLWSDLICYIAGVIVGAVIDRLLVKKTKGR